MALESSKSRFQAKRAFFGESFGSVSGVQMEWVGCFHGREGGH